MVWGGGGGIGLDRFVEGRVDRSVRWIGLLAGWIDLFYWMINFNSSRRPPRIPPLAYTHAHIEPHPSHRRTAPVVEGEEAASETVMAAEEWTSLSNARTFPASVCC